MPSVSWVGETDIGGIQEVALDSTTYQTRLILKACQDLNAFQLLAFSVENVDENGSDENGVEKKYCFQIDGVGEPVLMEWDEVK